MKDDKNLLTRRSFLKEISKCFFAIFGFYEALNLLHPRQAFSKNTIGKNFEPAYLRLQLSGELKSRGEALWEIMSSCELCPRRCGVNRIKGKSGFCKAPGATLVISAFHPHFGEERPLVGYGGSGTIFFTHCNLRCVFCQNFEISHLGRGSKATIEELAEMMLALQKIGCHNINLVTPTHYSPHIVKALDIACKKGLRLPIVYNTSGWERLEILKILDGIVDIYLPDFKYWESDKASKYSQGASSYPELTKIAILEMHRQVGVAKPEKDGIIRRGLIIRHLVMPNGVAGSEKVMEWIAQNLPKDTYVNIMAQYTPLYKAFDYPEISRRITKEEYDRVVKKAKELNLRNLDIQGLRWFL
ncbi:MAG: radical SAM protein [Desulfobacterota bacterium]|nr:radical SAM protein [Thermodesulfobacteriota bacterium]MDW8002837.1 radical SAM protein [Deltaproteobacteria bacterium]